MNGREILAFNLKRLRADRDISQEALADAADIDRTYASSLERCIYSASIDVIERLANALDVPLAEMLRLPKK